MAEKRKRGPYKSYTDDDSHNLVPRRSLTYLNQEIDNPDQVIQQQQQQRRVLNCPQIDDPDPVIQQQQQRRAFNVEEEAEERALDLADDEDVALAGDEDGSELGSVDGEQRLPAPRVRIDDPDPVIQQQQQRRAFNVEEEAEERALDLADDEDVALAADEDGSELSKVDGEQRLPAPRVRIDDPDPVIQQQQQRRSFNVEEEAEERALDLADDEDVALAADQDGSELSKVDGEQRLPAPRVRIDDPDPVIQQQQQQRRAFNVEEEAEDRASDLATQGMSICQISSSLQLCRKSMDLLQSDDEDVTLATYENEIDQPDYEFQHVGGHEDEDLENNFRGQEPQDDLPDLADNYYRAPPTHNELRKNLQTQSFISPISTPLKASPAEALLMTLLMHKQNNSSFKAFVDSVKLINNLFVSPVLPKSAYLLDKLLNSDSGITRYFYCENCFYCFGNLDHIASPNNICPECNVTTIIKDLTKATFFALYDIPSQIELLFMDKKIRKSLVDPKNAVKQNPPNLLKDLYDGKCYRDFVSALPDVCLETIISFTSCTDGTPLFKSSTFSVWPFFLSINELPPKTRMEHLLVGGIWFGLKKPPMDLFLDPVADHLKQLSVNGFEICVNGDIMRMKAYTLACCVDSGARGAVQGINTHSGYFSCNWCEIPGQYCENKVVFPFQEIPPKLRTHDDIVKYADECVSDEKLSYVYGVQYLSPLAKLKEFDLVNGMVQDFTHNVPFGISRTFLQEWISNTSRGFYIGSPDDILELDKKMKQLTPCIEVRRPPRVVSNNSNWNAREYENWTLFYSLPVLSNILPLKYFNHWSCLVQAIYLLSRDTTTHEDVNNAHKLLLLFISEAELLYGKSHMSYNIHILSHLAENVARWGPVWAVSMYCFESGIKDLKHLLHAERGVPHQIHRALNYRKAENILSNVCEDNGLTQAFQESISAKPNQMTKYLPLDECVLLGSSSHFTPNEEEKFLIEQSLYDIDVTNCAVYQKIIMGKCVYTSLKLATGKRFCNSYAMLSSGQIIVIQKFLLDKSSDKVFVFYNNVCCETMLRFPQQVRLDAKAHCLRIVSSIGARLDIVSVGAIKIVCVKTDMNDKIYITPIPQLNNVF